MIIPAPPPVLILAGGLGRRMDSPAQGAPQKPLVHLGGQPLLSHVIDRMRPQAGQLLLNVNGPSDDYAAFGLPLIPDPVPGHPGPLAGVAAGLEYLARTAPAAFLVSVAADTPFLPMDLVRRLADRHSETGGVVCAGSGGQRHPVIAVWPATVLAALQESLKEGRLKVGLFLDALNAVTVVWDSNLNDPFFNVNTPEDLAIAEIRLSARQ
ncbi:molybdenum cofactor guanylyltransferase MobA [Xanthobacter sp. KR7-65]|uniref:molybdenum cofactor guanylyltransferase MobA n=1 Tax=Xanthobacter sp. KR7-65 TaxID=3156612 RepID=UPI0032B4633A